MSVAFLSAQRSKDPNKQVMHAIFVAVRHTAEPYTRLLAMDEHGDQETVTAYCACERLGLA